MRGYLVAGNWKMNGGSAANAELVAGILEGATSVGGIDLLVCPPFPYLGAVAGLLEGSAVSVGGQNLSEFDSGAYTGEVAGPMLREIGCRYVIVGHSERRALMGESSAAVARKFVAAQRSGLTPILCVGETLQERQAVERFQALLGDFKAADFVSRIRQVYAEDLYFNDTLKTILRISDEKGISTAVAANHLAEEILAEARKD